MKRGLLLVTLFLIMKLHFSHSRREETGSRTASSDQTVKLEDLQRTILRRESEPDPDSFYGMLGKRNSDLKQNILRRLAEPDPDSFYGMLGKRNSDLKQNILRRLAEPDPDSFYGMLGKRNADEDSKTAAKRETDELFFGLMGKRSSDSDNSPWRREYPEQRGVFLNKFRLRSLRGL
ncbi:tachykinin-3a isoform X2 [Gambusia affinis]|uniref:tachykinin-3a isoform X2 n=1 Tax=Gambusia affinis TaxID=33528 RepID=UPI001CDB6EBD|nr:tachykinin-3a isoform X2 [Gambusia affinis]